MKVHLAHVSVLASDVDYLSPFETFDCGAAPRKIKRRVSKGLGLVQLQITRRTDRLLPFSGTLSPLNPPACVAVPAFEIAYYFIPMRNTILYH